MLRKFVPAARGGWGSPECCFLSKNQQQNKNSGGGEKGYKGLMILINE